MDVLIADDEPLARERLAALVDGLGGHRVVGAVADGRAVIEACTGPEARPEVVLLDIEMPGMDGLEAARHLADPVEAKGSTQVDPLEPASLGGVQEAVIVDEIDRPVLDPPERMAPAVGLVDHLARPIDALVHDEVGAERLAVGRHDQRGHGAG